MLHASLPFLNIAVYASASHKVGRRPAVATHDTNVNCRESKSATEWRDSGRTIPGRLSHPLAFDFPPFKARVRSRNFLIFREGRAEGVDGLLPSGRTRIARELDICTIRKAIMSEKTD